MYIVCMCHIPRTPPPPPPPPKMSDLPSRMQALREKKEKKMLSLMQASRETITDLISFIESLEDLGRLRIGGRRAGGVVADGAPLVEGLGFGV